MVVFTISHNFRLNEIPSLKIISNDSKNYFYKKKFRTNGNIMFNIFELALLKS